MWTGEEERAGVAAARPLARDAAGRRAAALDLSLRHIGTKRAKKG